MAMVKFKRVIPYKMEKYTIGNIVKSKAFMITIFVIIIGLEARYAFNKFNDLKTDLVIAEQNQSALKDTIRISANKIGELVYSKEILVAKHVKDIKDLNHTLAEAYKENTKKGEKIHELSVLLGKIKHDTVYIDNTKLLTFSNGDKGIEFNFNKVYDSENYRIIEGVTRFKYDTINNKLTPLQAMISKDEIGFNLTQGIRTRKDGKVEMFASSSYPGFKVSELNYVIINPKTHPALTKFTTEKKLRVGVYGGYGATLNLSTSTISVGPQIGAGLTYIIW